MYTNVNIIFFSIEITLGYLCLRQASLHISFCATLSSLLIPQPSFKEHYKDHADISVS